MGFRRPAVVDSGPVTAENLQVVDPVQQFSTLMAADEPDLGEAALAIAAGAEPDLDRDHWLGELDRLADGVDSLEGLLQRLFVEEGFRGNTQRYYDPRNSLLDKVLARRLGIPITLSVVCIEVGRRAGVPLEGVGMPGHFLLRHVGGQQYVDAFDGGKLLDLADCEVLYRNAGAARKPEFGPRLLRTVSTKDTLLRMLHNLRIAYGRSVQPVELEWVLRMRLALPDAGPAELRELATAMGQQGRFVDGALVLEEAAPEFPNHSDAMVNAARGLRARLN